MSEYTITTFLETAIYPLFDLTDTEEQILRSETKIVTLNKESLLIKENMIANDLFFIDRGLIRSFYHKDYREINTEFFFENDFFTALTSFLTGEKTRLNFQCLEPSEIIVIPKALIDNLLLQDQKWHLLLNRILKKEFIKKCRRESSFLLCDSNERYLSFLEQFPLSESRIPLFHIASYLGISPETLSRIRSKKINQIDISQVHKI
ncbi:MAG: Crp/Fnr family transcriptional regulator [Chryseobacterium sp.]|uniref:Crp/Fnr family transcriptional regulator n=1 Tax=Chryseobacterium sp. TaxID=1871047 RepID=UPI0025C5D5C4|nr:Crp/Fnr family transcriptional regulator [Chryseobacterium sp.]MCJ7932658.1 Crp/Fnr family transcriptional regulator [Chryseobacterium sp.]